MLDTLEAAGGEMRLKDLCEAMHRKRPWDVRRRILRPLEEAGIIECEGDVIRLVGEWLSPKVWQQFPLKLSKEVTLIITPFTESTLPGLILYTAKAEIRPKRVDAARARQAVAVSSADIQEVLIAARRDLQHMIEVQDAETKRLLIYAGVAVIIASAVAVAIATGGAGAPEAAILAEEAVAGGLGGAGLVVASEQVISLAAYRAASGVAIETIAEALPKIAASATVYLAGRQFVVPPETVGICIEGGCEAGEAATPDLPPQ